MLSHTYASTRLKRELLAVEKVRNRELKQLFSFQHDSVDHSGQSVRKDN